MNNISKADNKKCLIISSRYPYSYKGGDSLRTKTLIRYMMDLNYEVDLLAFLDDKKVKNIENPQDLKNIFIIKNYSSLLKYFSIFKSLFKFLPLQCSFYINDQTIPEIKKIKFRDYNCIIIFLSRLYPIKDFIDSNSNIIIDMADILTINYSKAWRSKGLSLKWRIIYSLEYPLMKKLENKILSSRYKKFLVSKRDINFALKNLNGNESNLFHIPNHIEKFSSRKIKLIAKKRIFCENPKVKFKICFIGNMAAQHNNSSVLKMCNRKFINKLSLINCQIYIVGSISDKQEQIYLRNGLKLIKRPENLYSTLSDFDYGISILNHCSGLQNKLYDYALLGLPIIASRDSAKGIGFIENKHYLEANNNNQLLNALKILNYDKNLAYKLVSNTIDFVEENFTKVNILKNLEDVLH